MTPVMTILIDDGGFRLDSPSRPAVRGSSNGREAPQITLRRSGRAAPQIALRRSGNGLARVQIFALPRFLYF